MAVAKRLNCVARLAAARPMLENGAEHTAEEFLHRYEQMPGVRAELLNGIVYLDVTYDINNERLVPSPVSHKYRGGPHARIGFWLYEYQLRTSGTDGSINSTIRMNLGENVPQPDLCLMILPECQGQVVPLPDGELSGAPELIVEIATSSHGRELGPKMEAYPLNRVREYIVWRTRDHIVDWFQLKGSRYQRMAATDGIFRSSVFPGLWLDMEALVQDQMRRIRRVLYQGLRSTEHLSFVKALAERGATNRS